MAISSFLYVCLWILSSDETELVFCCVGYSYNIPLVADIHFAPPVALRVAECFDKIRVNPGNFG